MGFLLFTTQFGNVSYLVPGSDETWIFFVINPLWTDQLSSSKLYNILRSNLVLHNKRLDNRSLRLKTLQFASTHLICRQHKPWKMAFNLRYIKLFHVSVEDQHSWEIQHTALCTMKNIWPGHIELVPDCVFPVRWQEFPPLRQISSCQLLKNYQAVDQVKVYGSSTNLNAQVKW